MKCENGIITKCEYDITTKCESLEHFEYMKMSF